MLGEVYISGGLVITILVIILLVVLIRHFL